MSKNTQSKERKCPKGYNEDILKLVSKSLGHNRIDVVANHYVKK